MTPVRTRRHMPWDTGRADAVTAEATLIFEVVWPIFRKTVMAVACCLTRDLDERDDLVHEAKLKLWYAEPGNYDLLNPGEEAYLRRALVNHMLNVSGRGGKKKKGQPADGRRVPSGEFEALAMQPAEIKAIMAQFMAG